MSIGAKKKIFKFQEFVAHNSEVRCLKIGRKSHQVLVTGGGNPDRKVNVWAIGNSNPILSLTGHTQSVECVSFDSQEEKVAAGAFTGTLKIWDLEHAKVLHTLLGHRSECTCVDFHPYGGFIASGSVDTNLKIWDTRKDRCIQTYRGHSVGISCLAFSPDGKWIVSGGEDGLVKLWDLTAGRLIHDFQHQGAVTSIDFHPTELLLATAAANGIAHIWDLESFGLVNSTAPEATPIRNVKFSPQGHHFLATSQNFLKVWDVEQSRCLDCVKAEWTDLKDLVINSAEQVVVCATRQSSVSVWALNLNQIRPFLAEEKENEMDSAVIDSSVAAESNGGAPSANEAAKQILAFKSGDNAVSASTASLYQAYTRDIVTPNPQLRNPDNEEPVTKTPKTQTPAPVVSSIQRPLSTAAAVAPTTITAPIAPTTNPVQPVPSLQPSLPSSSSSSSTTTTLPVPSRSIPRVQTPVSPNYEDSVTPKETAQSIANEAKPKESTDIDFESFRIQEKSTPKEDSAMAIAKRLVEPHEQIWVILGERLENIQKAGSIWDSGDTNATIQMLLKSPDVSTMLSVLPIILRKPNTIKLDHCVHLIPKLTDVLSCKREDQALASIEILHNIVPKIGDLVVSTLHAQAPLKVDISQEERIEKCKVVLAAMKQLKLRLSTLCCRTGKLKTPACSLRDTLARFTDT